MSNPPVLEHPNGAVPGICSGAIGTLALLIAFIGYTVLNTKRGHGPWLLGDFAQIGLALLAAVSLALVPWMATQPQAAESAGRSIERARLAYLTGAVSAIGSMAVFVARDFLASHG